MNHSIILTSTFCKKCDCERQHYAILSNLKDETATIYLICSRCLEKAEKNNDEYVTGIEVTYRQKSWVSKFFNLSDN